MPYGIGGTVAPRSGASPLVEQGAVASGKIKERVHSIAYSASVNKLLLDVEVDQTEGSVKTDIVGKITIQNTGEPLHMLYLLIDYGLPLPL